jgi:hypothetical protein
MSGKIPFLSGCRYSDSQNFFSASEFFTRVLQPNDKWLGLLRYGPIVPSNFTIFIGEEGK